MVEVVVVVLYSSGGVGGCGGGCNTELKRVVLVDVVVVVL